LTVYRLPIYNRGMDTSAFSEGPWAPAPAREPRGRRLRHVVWWCVAIGSGVILAFLVAHIVPAAGAAGGCGGG
jgi:hypothetical protein